MCIKTLSLQLSNFSSTHLSFELAQVNLKFRDNSVQFFCVYRPPPSKRNKLTETMFFEEFPNLLDYCNNFAPTPIILGDHNFWFDKPLKPNKAKMLDLLDVFNLSQSVKEPTHIKGHILDWVIFNPDTNTNVLLSTSVSHDLSSDHYAVCLDLNVDVPAPVPVYKELRSLRSIDKSARHSGTISGLVSSSLSSTADQLYSSLRATLDRHAPVSHVW